MKKDQEILNSKYFDWSKARFFYYIAKFGSGMEASKFLNISQSALSRKMKDLEYELGCHLLNSSTRGYTLTRKGEEFFAIIEETFLKLKSFNYNNMVMSHEGQKRKIRISTTHAIASYVLSEHVLEYNKLHPELHFDIITDDQLIDLFVNDVDITVRPYTSKDENIIQEPFFTLEKKLYASQEYIEKYGEPISAEELINHYIIAHAQPENHPYSDVQWVLRLGMPVGKLKDPVFTANSLECLVKAAQKGLGIIGGYDEMEIMRTSGLKRILTSLTGPINEEYISYPSFLKEDRILIEFKDYLIKKIQQNCSVN
jgi:DNA-binding transcriptional LysR family regulator